MPSTCQTCDGIGYIFVIGPRGERVPQRCPDCNPPADSVKRLRQRAREPISRCYHCGGPTKLYRRKLNSGMAAALCWMVSQHGNDWCHLASDAGKIILRNRDYSKLEHWGLAEQQANKNRTKRTSGVWRATPAGIDFVLNGLEVPSHVFLSSPGNRFLGFEDTYTTVRTALGKHFDYDKLMRGIS